MFTKQIVHNGHIAIWFGLLKQYFRQMSRKVNYVFPTGLPPIYFIFLLNTPKKGKYKLV